SQASIAAAQVSSSNPTVTLVQLPNGQTVQVHGVIQAAQPSVIQSPQVQTVQICSFPVWNETRCNGLMCVFFSFFSQISTVAESEDSQESVDSVTDSQKRREILSRRPSYRRILNDLSSDAPAVPRIEEEKSEDDSAPAITTVTMPTPIYQTSSGQYSKWLSSGMSLACSRLLMPSCCCSRHHSRWSHPAGQQRHGRRAGPADADHGQHRGSQPGATILQYAQTSDGQQILVPSNQVVVQGGSISSLPCPERVCDASVCSRACVCLSAAASGDVQAYQIRTAATSAITPGVVMATSPALGAGGVTEEVTRKREVRLMKNRWGRFCVPSAALRGLLSDRFSRVLSVSGREAARECRRKKKEYVKCLENRVAVLENQNKTLIEELKALKDLYCHKSE
ncbi:unnamed protein product, partial [Tetraodon nigroviridis]